MGSNDLQWAAKLRDSGALATSADGKTHGTGENWFETPGSHHRVSENASATEPARLLAVFVVDEDDRPADHSRPRLRTGT